jgi:hypothetical protein
VLTLVLVLLLLWLVLAVLLAAGAVWLQGSLYSEPAAGVLWRAPAAAAALTLVVCVWTFLYYRAPGRYPVAPWDAVSEGPQLPQELRVRTREGKEEVFKLTKDERGRPEYRDGSRRRVPDRPEQVIIVEDGQRRVFVPERDAKTGNFKVAQGESLRYYEEGAKGRYMVEGQWGRVSSSHVGRTLLYVFLNLLHFVAWWAVLWLLMRFQWSHALGLAVALWAAVTLFVLPPLLTRAEEAARQRAGTKAASSSPLARFGGEGPRARGPLAA